MEYVQLGKTGLTISKLSLGAMGFGSRIDKSTSFAILDKAYDLGINFIDTADSYTGSEQIIGEWLDQSGVRDDFIISTKVGWPVGKGHNDRGLSRTHIRRQIQKSMERLCVDRIDIYQPHYLNNGVKLIDIIHSFAVLVSNGLISHIGGPIFTKAYQVLRWYYEAEKYGLPNIELRQMVYSLVSRSMDTTDLIDISQKIDIPLLGFAPLGGGLLTGKYTSDKSFPEDGRESFKKIYNQKRTDDLMNVISEIADAKGLTNLQVAFAWVLNQDITVSSIIGVSNPEQLDLLVDSLEINLTDEELDILSSASNKYHIW